MYFKVKASKHITLPNGKDKTVLETYLTEGMNFLEAGYKIMQIIGEDDEIEDVCMMKTFKPSVNDKFAETNKLFVVKIAEDVMSEDGTIKTLKYVLPAFADDSNQLQQIMQDYISQGFENMRLTTISETKWIYI
jgi:hypothetical protein